MNDFPDSVVNCELHMFADDDTTIFTVGSSADEVCIALQDVMNEVYKWCSLNQLTVHEGKTEAVTLNGKNFIGPLQPKTFGTKVIDYKDSQTVSE